MISFTSRGDWSRTDRWLSRLAKGDFYKRVEAEAQRGVDALAASTPQDSGKTAMGWDYTITQSGSALEIEWVNNNVNQGIPIAVLIQYGHGTGTGGYVRGRDFINPAMRPIFDSSAENVWREVVSD